MRRLSFFQYGAIKIHRDGSVRQRPVPECTLASSVRRGHPGPAPGRPGARPQALTPGPGTRAALGGSGTSEGASGTKPQRGGGRSRSAPVSGLHSEAPFPQLARELLPLPGTPGLPVDQKPSPPASVLPFLQNSSYLPLTSRHTYAHLHGASSSFFQCFLTLCAQAWPTWMIPQPWGHLTPATS